MIVLGIETSGNVGSVALLDGERAIGELSFEKGMIHGRELVPAIQEILTQASLHPADVDLIAVDLGPGSYTGLRVGLATAKGLAYALKKELIGVSSLDALAENVPAEGRQFLCPLIDARWKQVYCALYEAANGAWRKILDDHAVLPEAIASRIDVRTTIFGDGVDRYRDILLRNGGVEGPAAWNIPKASTVAKLGAKAYHGGLRHDPTTLAPRYLRRTEAEVKRDERGTAS